MPAPGNLLKLWALIDGENVDEYFPIEIKSSSDVFELKRCIQSPTKRVPGARPEQLVVWKFHEPMPFEPESSLLSRIEEKIDSAAGDTTSVKLSSAQQLATWWPCQPPTGLHCWITSSVIQKRRKPIVKREPSEVIIIDDDDAPPPIPAVTAPIKSRLAKREPPEVFIIDDDDAPPPRFAVNTQVTSQKRPDSFECPSPVASRRDPSVASLVSAAASAISELTPIPSDSRASSGEFMDIQDIEIIEETSVMRERAMGMEIRGVKRSLSREPPDPTNQSKRPCLREHDNDLDAPHTTMPTTAAIDTQLSLRCHEVLPESFRATPKMFAQFEKLPCGRIAYKDEEEELTLVIKPGSDIFVRIRELNEAGKLLENFGYKDSDDCEPEFWKCRVLDIRKWKPHSLQDRRRPDGCPRWWIRVRWFYQPDTAEKRNLILPREKNPDHPGLGYLGNAELLFSNDESIIPAHWVVWFLTVRDFTDMSHTAAIIPRRDWFYRLGLDIDKKILTGVTKHCHPQCRGVYDPVTDCQRYCRHCGIWYDLKCLQALSKGERKGPHLINVGSLCRNVPIERGHGLKDDYFPTHKALPSENVWQTTGNGNLLELVRSWARLGVSEDDWEEKLKKEFLSQDADIDDEKAGRRADKFVHQMLKRWLWYRCIGRNCKQYI